MLKTSIILSPAVYDGKPLEKGIVTLEKFNNKTVGTLKCYNLPELKGKMLLGVVAGNNNFKFDVTKTCNKFSFDLPREVSLDKKISCVVVNIENRNSNPVVWGSTETNKLWKTECLNVIDNYELKTEKLETKPQAKPNNYESKIIVNKELINDLKTQIKNEYVDDETKKLIDKEMQKYDEEQEVYDSLELNQQKSDFKEHKNVFNVSHAGAGSKILEEHEQPEDNEQAQRFYDLVKDQVKDLFEKFEPENSLEDIIPNSKFVKVDFEENGDHYIFGIIYDNNNLEEYLVYGIPALYTNEPPNELDGYYQWLPLDVSAPEEDGYWLMYQDARTGENIKMQML